MSIAMMDSPAISPTQYEQQSGRPCHARPAPAQPPAVRTADAELAWLEQQSQALEGLYAEEILTWAVDTYFPRFTMATGLGPEGCVIISMLAKIEPRVYVFNLDTGYQFPETLELRRAHRRKYGMEVDLQQPALPVAEYEAATAGRSIRPIPTAAASIAR